VFGEYGDAMGEFEWLENLLRQMEKDGEIGIFFTHISPGMDACFSEVAVRVQTLMDRFQNILRLNLFGHTHNEEFEVIRAVEDGKPIGTNHLGPSLTTKGGMNPSFRAFTLDVKTLLPLKIETYTMDLLKANEDDKHAIFSKNHEMTEAYGLDDLSPNSFFSLALKFKDNEELATKFYMNRYANSPRYLPERGCDEECRRRLSCKTSNSVYSDVRKCYNWSDIMKESEIQSYINDFLYGYWVTQKQ